MAQATSTRTHAPGVAVEAVMSVLRAEDELSTLTLDRLESLMLQFAGYAERGRGVSDINAADVALVRAFLDAPTSEGAAPGVSMQHFRRLAVRVLFRTAGAIGIAGGDPSIGCTLPPRPRGAFRPLENDEIELARAATLGSTTRMRWASAWALCEATARTGELGAIRRLDVDLDRRRVWIGGTRVTAARWGQLTEWGASLVARRLREIEGSPHTPVITGSANGATLSQPAAVGLIAKTLTRAGLGDAVDLRPSSVAAWAGRTIFDETGRIDVVAARLGMRSLDRTARFIGWDWTAADG